MKIKIIEIIEWEEDSRLIAGDASRNGDRAVERLVEEEKIKKIDNGIAEGLPFICDAEDEDDALEQYNNAICEYDYLKASACEFEKIF